MSDRSNAWYAVPENRERRKDRMSAYSRALSELVRMFPAEHRRKYLKARADGVAHSSSWNRSAYALRKAYPAKFRRLYDRQLALLPFADRKGL